MVLGLDLHYWHHCHGITVKGIRSPRKNTGRMSQNENEYKDLGRVNKEGFTLIVGRVKAKPSIEWTSKFPYWELYNMNWYRSGTGVLNYGFYLYQVLSSDDSHPNNIHLPCNTESLTPRFDVDADHLFCFSIREHIRLQKQGTFMPKRISPSYQTIICVMI